MATIYRCDKCDSEQKEPLVKVSIPIYNRYKSYKSGDEYDFKSIDLCDNCISRLNDFIKPDPKMTKEI